MKRPKKGSNEEIRGGLNVCSEWVHDGHGDAKKDCGRCPYQDPTDPAGMNCGERLMNDAGVLIDEQKARIEELESQVRKMSRELARSSQREYNE